MDMSTWFNWTQLAGLGIAATFLFTTWNHIRNFINRISQFVICTASVEGDSAAGLACLLRHESKPLEINIKQYYTWLDYDRKTHKQTLVAAEQYNDGKTYFLYFRNAVIAVKVLSLWSGMHSHKVTISYIRGTLDIDKLVVESCEITQKMKNSNNKTHSRYAVYWCIGKHRRTGVDVDVAIKDGQNSGELIKESNSSNSYINLYKYHSRVLNYNADEIGEINLWKNPIDSIVIPDYLLPFLREAETWHKSREFYISRGLNFKRGWFCSGDPGTGKTAFIRALGGHLDMPIIIMDLSSMDNSELAAAWKNAKAISPCFIVMEDIDSVFNGRENISGGHLSFDCLLNHLDGVSRTDGIFIVLTSNYPEKIDSALFDRPGRIDRHIKFRKLEKDDCQKIAERILKNDFEGIDFLMDRYFDSESPIEEKYTAAMFEKICMDYTLEKMWKQADATLFKITEENLVSSNND